MNLSFWIKKTKDLFEFLAELIKIDLLTLEVGG